MQRPFGKGTLTDFSRDVEKSETNKGVRRDSDMANIKLIGLVCP